MGSDGIIFKQLAIIHPKTMTPIFGTVVSGLFTGIMTLIFDLQQLIDMMSIGTLLAYAIVAVSVLILRYMRAIIFKYVYCNVNYTYCNVNYTKSNIFIVSFRYQPKECASNTRSVSAMNDYKVTSVNILKQIINLQNQKEVTEMSNKVAKYSIGILCKY